jgi:hypothetical protein
VAEIRVGGVRTAFARHANGSAASAKETRTTNTARRGARRNGGRQFSSGTGIGVPGVEQPMTSTPTTLSRERTRRIDASMSTTDSRSAAAVTTRLSREGSELVAALKIAHRCPPDCPACAAERSQVGVPSKLSDWEDFIRSTSAQRMVRHVKRTGRSFPRVTNDEVTQFLVEEAAFEVAAILEVQARSSSEVMVPEGMPVEESPAERHQRLMREARGS